VKSARTSLQAVNMSSKDQRDAVIQDTALTYIELNKWDQDIDLLNTAVNNNLKMETVEQERIKAGVDSPVEENRAKLATARVRVRLVEAKGSADVLRMHLAQLTGLSAAELQTDADSIPNFPEVKQEDNLAARAGDVNPAVKAAQQQAIAKQFTAQAEHRALYPSFDVAGQYALLSNFNNYQVYIQRFQHHNATGGLVLRFPFFDSTQRAKAAQAKADAIRSSHEADVAKEKISLETLRVQRMVQELDASVEVAQLEYNLAQSDLQAIQVQMQSGTGTLRQEQDARSKVEQTYDALIDANFALDKARVQLLRNTGDLEQWARSGK
jgi:outer membrane protein TolC